MQPNKIEDIYTPIQRLKLQFKETLSREDNTRHLKPH